MSSLKVILPDQTIAEELESDILSTVYQELQRYNYEAVAAGDATGEYTPLDPRGRVHLESTQNTRVVRVSGTDIDTHDLYTAVLADLEQRRVGLTGEID
ncbi:hypothetical protein ACXYX3_14370 [Mycobacterium sp. C3-094]|uniref:hypothetical protein n=1 Tax=Mycobacterium sp. PSTR-4-N TaxID=2917745 RepID=UPI001F14D02F|nr:hypothetical protein [Mycobacterium sp. PSTR-4-N]MCG7597605.1 hypothetical protein [Mycobacterium sp. PSTR-4-N]